PGAQEGQLADPRGADGLHSGGARVGRGAHIVRLRPRLRVLEGRPAHLRPPSPLDRGRAFFVSEQPVKESMAGDVRDDAEPAEPEDEPVEAAESPAHDEAATEPVEEPIAEQEPEGSDEPPASEVLEAQVEVVE